ncbi:MAG: hypothetical protein GXX78_05805 [Bacteroidales bacterium]|nr:hypothetical protein [Bacteroidales bacterium]
MTLKKLIPLLLICIPLVLKGQVETFSQNWFKNWRTGFMLGGSYLTSEIKKDFSKSMMEMNPQITNSFMFFLDKRFYNNFELGIEFEKNYFKGEKTYPNQIIWLKYHSRFNSSETHFVPDPIYYKTNTTSWYINGIYNFKNLRSQDYAFLNMNMYLKMGFGLTAVGVETGYLNLASYNKSNLPNPFYEKGQGIQKIKDLFGSFHAGIGVNYYISPRISISGEYCVMFVSNDYLDGIQNFEATYLPNNNVAISRMEVYGFINEIKVGLAYHFNWYRKLRFSSSWEQNFEDFSNEFYFGKKTSKGE